MAKTGKNIYLRKDGRWEGRFIKDRIDGKIKYGYVFGKTREEVENRLSDLKNQNKESINPVFSHISSEWIQVQKPQLKESSISKYENILNSYLIPSYGNRIIEEITRSEVTSYSLELLSNGGIKRSGLAPKTVNSILSVLKNIFKYAEREMNLSIADISDIGVKQPQQPLRILSVNEQQRICSYLYCNISPSNLGILLCLYTGLRIGEICALKWSDINTDDRILHIHQTMQRIQISDGSPSKTKVVILPPKSNCSIRDIPIPDEMLQTLLPYQEEDEKYLLTGMEHLFIEPHTMENRFKRVAEKCSIQDVKFHSLRHTFATRCVELGFDIKSLSEILGHASVNITLNRYVHSSMDLKQQNMNKLTGFITLK